jgi:signal recognition particle receptor subunit beta
MKMLAHPDLAKAAILIFANKQDLQGALPPEKIAEALELTMITRHQWRIQPCSALTQQGLSDGMSWIASQVQQPA